MYCKKCGKYLDGDKDLCEECKALEASEGDVMTGFGKALSGAIIGNIGNTLAIVAMEILAGLIEMLFSNNQYSFRTYEKIADSGLIICSIVLMVIGLALSIIALIFGIKSIKTYKLCIAEGRKKPIPTLILGIVGVVTSGLTLLFISISIILLIVVSDEMSQLFMRFHVY